MRLFIAITLSDEEKKKLRMGIESLRAEAEGGSYTRVENLHLTVAFLGEVPKRRISDICAVLDSVKGKAFQLRTDHAGVFHRDDGAICWMGIHNDHVLDSLYHEVCLKLRNKGFDLPDREYRPHLTLGRRVRGVNREILARVTEAAGIITIAADSLTLMESKRMDGRLVYEPVYEKRLEVGVSYAQTGGRHGEAKGVD